MVKQFLLSTFTQRERHVLYVRLLPLRSAHTRRGLVPATSPCNYSPLTSLHEETGRRDLSHEQFTRSVLGNKSQELFPKIQTSFAFVGLDAWTKLESPWLDSVAKMAGSHDRTCLCDLFSSSLVCNRLKRFGARSDFQIERKYEKCFEYPYVFNTSSDVWMSLILT